MAMGAMSIAGVFGSLSGLDESIAALLSGWLLSGWQVFANGMLARLEALRRLKLKLKQTTVMKLNRRWLLETFPPKCSWFYVHG